MAGNRTGGLKTKELILAKNPRHYQEMGAKGGRAPTKYPKGFAAMPPEKRAAGRKGGQNRRGYKKPEWKPIERRTVRVSSVDSSSTIRVRIGSQSANSSAPSKHGSGDGKKSAFQGSWRARLARAAKNWG